MEVRGQLTGVSSLSPCESWDLNSGCRLGGKHLNLAGWMGNVLGFSNILNTAENVDQ